MKLHVGADHGGFRAKVKLVRALEADGHRVTDVGTSSAESTDYPDYARLVAKAVADKRADRGVLLCGTGIGMAIAANKFMGIRAAVVWNERTAALAAGHNGANVLCLGGRVLPAARIVRLVKVWLQTPFEGGRHQRRLNKIRTVEKGGTR